jgi:uncharacterized protein
MTGCGQSDAMSSEPDRAGPVFGIRTCHIEVLRVLCRTLRVLRVSKLLPQSARKNSAKQPGDGPQLRNSSQPSPHHAVASTMTSMASQTPSAIQGQKYISLKTFRRNGIGVPTPVWFGEDGGKLYVMTRSDMGKTKRIRNNPKVTVAPCTIRGKVIGPEFPATARILPRGEFAQGRTTINRKYWMARIPWIWRKTDTCIEVSFG